MIVVEHETVIIKMINIGAIILLKFNIVFITKICT